jgi:hypothetical protein
MGWLNSSFCVELPPSSAAAVIGRHLGRVLVCDMIVLGELMLVLYSYRDTRKKKKEGNIHSVPSEGEACRFIIFRF